MSGNTETPEWNSAKHIKELHMASRIDQSDSDEARDKATPSEQDPAASVALPSSTYTSAPPASTQPVSPTASVQSGASASLSYTSVCTDPRLTAARRKLFMSKVRRLPLPHHLGQLPEGFRELVRDMRGFEVGWKIISSSEVGKEVVETGTSLPIEHILDESGERALHGRDPNIQTMKRLVQRTARNAQSFASDASWNCFVNGPVLTEALRGSRFSDKLICDDITDCTISQEFFHEDANPIPTKLNFLCIALELGRQCKRALYLAEIETLNHTDYLGLVYSPIAISIQARADGETSTEDTLQLQTWVSAQRRFLRAELQKSGRSATPLPPLPLVVVQGSRWWTYYFVENPNPAVDKDHTLYTGEFFGDTSTLRGIFSLVAGLQRLIVWAEEQYRPWFMQNIVEPRFPSLVSTSVPTD
ncbi:Hypothetical predicted protein [Lecanosticta acicola]|uniref:PD-(D/E)XK nuclease-like domain-containing protein n=1 Tax=Lecanosticta acicola TaxID=111012 RepID=A0AAI9EAW7_9PEZI|nr:Hypothetical predicted protein [Lecanosticta acicola]